MYSKLEPARLTPTVRTINLGSTCKGPFETSVVSVAGRFCVTVGTTVNHTPTDMTIAIDHSGSMMSRYRQVVASKVAVLFRDHAVHTVVYGFGNTVSVDSITPETYRALNTGTALNAAASAIIKAANYPGIASNAAICIITDCEAVHDYATAFATLRSSEVVFVNRRLFLIGIGNDHFIPDLQSLLPVESALSTFYVNVSDTSIEIPSDVLLGILHAVPITYRGTTIYVKPGTSYLFPAGYVLDDITVYDFPLSGFPRTVIDATSLPSRPILVTLAEAAACTATRLYNAALASLKQLPGVVDVNAQNVALRPVREHVAAGLVFLDALVAQVTASDHATEWSDAGTSTVSDRVREVEDAVLHGGSLPELSAATIQRYRMTLRRMPGAQSLLNILRDIKELVDAVVTPESYAAAAELFDATSRGNLAVASLTKLKTKVAKRQVDDAWQKTLGPLVDFEVTGVRVTGSPFPRLLTAPEADAADTIDGYGVGEHGYPWPCCVTMVEGNASVVAVGAVSRRHMVGALNPAITRVEAVNMMPYHLTVVHHCFENGIVNHAYDEDDDEVVTSVQPHCFATHIGTVNGIVGLMPGPGRSHAHALALGVMASEVGTGTWTTPGHGFRALVAVGLIGVAYLLEHGRNDDARVLAFGFLGTAARVGCRELQATGETKEDDAYILALVAAERLLEKAAASPTMYLGPKLFRAEVWRALIYAMELLHSMRESTPTWDVAGFNKALTVYDVASSATWAMQPKSTTDSPLFASEKKAIAAFRTEVASRIGLPVSVAGCGPAVEDAAILSDALRGFAAQAMTYTYCAPSDVDFQREGLHESAFLDAYLPATYRDRTCAARPWARAVFWAAISAKDFSKGISREALAASDDPFACMENFRNAAIAAGVAAQGNAEKELRAALKQAFFNAADCVPFGFYDGRPGFMVAIGSAESASVFKSDMTVPEKGVCVGRQTGMPQRVCTTMDSPAFLIKSLGAHRSVAYPTKGPSFSQNIPRFHATMSTFWTVSGVHDYATILGSAAAEWPDIAVDVLMTSVKQWLVQRQAFDFVKGSSASLTGEDVCRRLGIDCSAAAKAADWDSSDGLMVGTLYPDNAKQWSYAEAACHFYVAVKRDTMPLTGVFNAKPYLEALAVHRRFVVPRRIFIESVAAHGLVPSLFVSVERFNAIVQDVYVTEVNAFRA